MKLWLLKLKDAAVRVGLLNGDRVRLLARSESNDDALRFMAVMDIEIPAPRVIALASSLSLA